MTEYVIHKRTRLPGEVSYSGPTWDTAGLRHLYKPTYWDITEAHFLAGELSLRNPVGFAVAEINDE